MPAYAAFHEWLGRGEAMRPMREAWAAGDRKGALAAISDQLVDDLIVHGAPQACRERVAQYQASGLDTPVIAVVPPPGSGPADVADLLGLATFMHAAGITCSQRLGDLLAGLEPATEADAVRLLGAARPS